MADKKPEEMSLDELKTKEKSLKLAMGLFAGVLILLLLLESIWLSVKKVQLFLQYCQ
jgi:hypothetical protein